MPDSPPPNPPLALHVDTCALLDIVRLPMRSRAPVRELQAVRAVMTAVREGRATVQVSNVVPVEFARNEEKVLLEVQRHIRDLDEKSLVVRDCARDLSIGDIVWQLDPGSMGPTLRQLANDMLSLATIQSASDQDRLNAMDRQVNSLRPGRYGKDCLADCTITVTLLRCVREQGVRSIFLSSNVKDYSADEKSPRLHEDLKPAFEELGISYVTNWEWAARLVKGPIDRAV